MPTADIDGVSVDYTDTGVGPPMVFVPGLVGSKEWFRFQSSGLSDRYRVISYDLRRARRGVPYTVDELADDLSRLLAYLRLYGVVVAGHCMGALVATRFAIAHPERCLALVLLSAAPGFGAMSDQQILSELAPARMELDTWLNRIKKRLAPGTPTAEDDLDPLAYLARHNAGLDKPTLRARLRLMRECDLSDSVTELQAPTLVVAGSADHPHILAGSQVLHELVPDSTLEVLENTDHYCFYTRHDLVNTTIDDYIEARLSAL